jgi:hypothetical protein
LLCAKGEHSTVLDEKRPALVVVQRKLGELHRVLVDEPRLLLCNKNNNNNNNEEEELVIMVYLNYIILLKK